MDETSLEDFLDTDDASDGEDATVDDRSAVDDPGPAVDPETVDPATATAEWSPAGVACPSCGETANRRWIAEDTFVCADCQEW
ncbi:MAG: hypothetical protein ACI8XM_003075 [Haloarculaceae archaeon]|jgi:hypothetical protein